MSEPVIEVVCCGAKPEPPMGAPSDGQRCPKCGGEVEQGYGLAFGGIGVYETCNTDTCDWWWKSQDEGAAE